MKIGISTYAFFWHWSELAPKQLSLKEMIAQTKEYGGDVFQICDYPAIEKMDEQELTEIAAFAKSLNVELELGTRGTDPSILNTYLTIAKQLNVKLLRSMVLATEFADGGDSVIHALKEVLPAFAVQGVTIALETYEQVATNRLVELVEKIDSPFLGICLDPANTIASLEMPKDVIDQSAPHVVNLHVKDFRFMRNEGWVGFNLTGCSLGEGLLDFPYMLDKVRSNQHQVNVVLEFWLNFDENIEKTIEREKEWISNSMNYLRRNI